MTPLSNIALAQNKGRRQNDNQPPSHQIKTILSSNIS